MEGILLYTICEDEIEIYYEKSDFKGYKREAVMLPSDSIHYGVVLFSKREKELLICYMIRDSDDKPYIVMMDLEVFEFSDYDIMQGFIANLPSISALDYMAMIKRIEVEGLVRINHFM